MLFGRENELQYLNTVYETPGSQMIVVYGQKNVGKTSLLHEFTVSKETFYYTAISASTRQQQFMLAQKSGQKDSFSTEYPKYEDIFSVMQANTTSDRKKIFVFDEWEHMIKSDISFMVALAQLLHHAYSNQDVMIVLSSSSIGFIENDLVSKIGKEALHISSFLKVKELKFSDLICAFPSYSIQECVKIYSLLGGFPGLWSYFDPHKSVEQNICDTILKKGAFLQEEGIRIIKEELRETSVYNTILSALADGHEKLNDLYTHTGFSRAKISVYLKNLIELEIVEKVFSIDTPGKDSQKKGIYRISNTYVHFWFRYIYRNYGECLSMAPQDFYNAYIKPDFSFYCNEYFSAICREYMILSAAKGALSIAPQKFGLFDGKAGRIDYVGQDPGGRFVVAFCYYSKPMVTYEDYQANLSVLSQAKIKPEQIYIFASERFDETLILESKIKGNIILLRMDDL